MEDLYFENETLVNRLNALDEEKQQVVQQANLLRQQRRMESLDEELQQENESSVQGSEVPNNLQAELVRGSFATSNNDQPSRYSAIKSPRKMLSRKASCSPFVDL